MHTFTHTHTILIAGTSSCYIHIVLLFVQIPHLRKRRKAAYSHAYKPHYRTEEVALLRTHRL